ncbi:hypothetical protein SBDP1_160003 [Syntrophobacter sp. SbD1]|nr:hypothetical protein SBDP1_160003 [Syntrophobacter sp. SbD1]
MYFGLKQAPLHDFPPADSFFVKVNRCAQKQIGAAKPDTEHAGASRRIAIELVSNLSFNCCISQSPLMMRIMFLPWVQFVPVSFEIRAKT